MILWSSVLVQHIKKPESYFTGKKKSLLDLAAKILADTGEALNCKELVAKAKETGWESTGKTPEQTLYSGIFREIKEKGEASRFKKSADRKGSFEANNA